MASNAGPMSDWRAQTQASGGDAQYTSAPGATSWRQHAAPAGMGRRGFGRGRGAGRGFGRGQAYAGLPRDVCARCLQRGHWQSRCPTRNGFYGPPDVNNVQRMSGDGRSETYIDITTKGRSICAMLDSGCDRSICPLRLCRNAKIKEVNTQLYAANGSVIPVIGCTRVFF